MHTTLELSELENRIGRLFMAGLPGLELDEMTESLISKHGLGGVILFARNIETPSQLASLCRDLQEKAFQHQGTPLFLAVDQEGGRVARLKAPFSVFPGNEAIALSSAPEKRALEFARVTAREMKLVGLNMNLAPVVDVGGAEVEAHLVGRTFGGDPYKVAQLGQTVVRGLQENGVMAVAKHFPGLGKASRDPHHHLASIDSTLREIEEINLVPFQSAIEAGVSAIMTSHAVYPALDVGCPATLSEKVLVRLLRTKLRFKGLIITDDLEMGAVARQWGASEGALEAFQAGADILLICENQTKVLESMQALKEKLLKGAIPIERLHESVERIGKAKSKYLDKFKKASLHDVDTYFA
jgi:beta-N-acetylhexosaminidase